MPEQLPKSINLLNPVAVPKNTWEKVYDWVFSVGRFVIIMVELVVLAAFASRFVLDRKNNDLKEEIEARVEMVRGQESFENQIRQTQKALTEISILSKTQYAMSSAVREVLADIPDTIIVDTFTITQSTVSLACRAADYAVVQDLEQTFRSNIKYDNVKVSLTKTGETGEVTFTISLNIIKQS